MRTKSTTPYQTRLKNWELEEHRDCKNFKAAKEFCEKHGFSLRNDISYNGFIEIEKEICITDNPSDGHKLELQIWCDVNHLGHERYHLSEQFDMEWYTENDSILKPMKYRYKAVHEIEAHTSSKNLDELFAWTLKREETLKKEFADYLQRNPTTEWKCTDPDNFQYGRLNRGTPEFKEFNRDDFKKIFEQLKIADAQKVQAYIKEEFENKMLWVQKLIFLSQYNEKEREELASGYYKNLSELKEIYGKDWEFILAECAFEQENGLY